MDPDTAVQEAETPAPAAAAELALADPVEESDEEGSTFIEQERGDDRSARPWDPEKIRVDPKPFSLKQILDELEDGGIDLAPDFQRQGVWNLKQKVRLVESVLLRIPLPAFYFSADGSGLLSVVDGCSASAPSVTSSMANSPSRRTTSST